MEIGRLCSNTSWECNYISRFLFKKKEELRPWGGWWELTKTLRTLPEEDANWHTLWEQLPPSCMKLQQESGCVYAKLGYWRPISPFMSPYQNSRHRWFLLAQDLEVPSLRWATLMAVSTLIHIPVSAHISSSGADRWARPGFYTSLGEASAPPSDCRSPTGSITAQTPPWGPGLLHRASGKNPTFNNKACVTSWFA